MFLNYFHCIHDDLQKICFPRRAIKVITNAVKRIFIFFAAKTNIGNIVLFLFLNHQLMSSKIEAFFPNLNKNPAIPCSCCFYGPVLRNLYTGYTFFSKNTNFHKFLSFALD